MQKLKVALTGVTILLFASLGMAQGTISGGIIDDEDQKVSFATIMLFAANDSTLVKGQISNVDGKFAFSQISEGNYFVESNFVGYEKLTSKSFYFDGRSEMELPIFTMQASPEQLQEVVIETERELIEVQPDKTVFNVEGSINAKGNTALELLRRSPGVIVDNNENLLIQGKSGVLVYIDGKQSPLGGEDLAIYLKNLQSDQVEAIEIITNPSAKYDAEGNAGIINIRLMKDKNLGTNSTVNLGFRHGINPKYNGSVNLNNRRKKLNTFGSYSLFTGKNEDSSFLTRNQNGTFFDQANTSISDDVNHGFRFGTDFFIKRDITIGFLVSGNRSENEGFSTSETEISETTDLAIDSLLFALNDQSSTRDNTNYNLNFEWQIGEGKSLSLDLDHGDFENRTDSFQPNIYFLPDGTTELNNNTFSIVTPTDIAIYTAKIDFATKFLDGQLGAGIKSTNITTDNTFDYFNIEDGIEIKDLDRSNNFLYKERVNAAYLSWQKNLSEKVNLTSGIRIEHTHSDGELNSAQEREEDDDKVVRNYTDFFPSAGITYSLNKLNTVGISYSRRIDRPNYQDLNPFEFRLDELSFQKGNPFLRPQYSNTFGFTHTYKGTLSSSLSYTVIDDVSTQITEAAGENSARLIFVNLARQTNLGLTVSYPFSITEWWNVYATVTGYRLHNEANIEGDVIDLTTVSMNGYAQNTFTLPKGFQMEISGWYDAPAIWEGNWTTDSQWDISAGVSKQLFKKKGNLKVSISDIFLTNPWSGESNFGVLEMTGRGRWESRQVRINFSYTLGNSQIKGARKRTTGMEEESSRTSSN
ncbi:MAG: TonB-dependent receptor [Bacteroidota bacterium]